MFLDAGKEDSDQTALMCRLVRIFIGLTCNKIQLKYFSVIYIYFRISVLWKY